jgi:drug/metabolite transporter (DMT)-like permease
MERGGIALPFILVTLIWSSTWIVIRDQLGSVPASWSVCYRFLLAGLAISGGAAWSLPHCSARRSSCSISTSSIAPKSI